MQIKSLLVRNFRCWENLEINNFTKYNVFIGENSSGKSSILISLFLNLTSNTQGMSQFIMRKKGSSDTISKIVFSNDEIMEFVEHIKIQKPINIPLINKLIANSIIWGTVGWESSITSAGQYYNPTNDVNRLLSLSKDNAIKIDLERKKTFPQYFTGRKGEPESMKFHIGEQNRDVGNVIRKQIIEFIPTQPIFISAKRKLIQEITQNRYNAGNVFNGSKLKSMLHDAKNSAEKRRIDGFNRFQEIVETWSFSPGRPDISAKAGDSIDLIFWKKDGTSIFVEEVGDGVKEAVLIAGVCLTYPERTFFIEEPELHLHPRALRELRELFKYEIQGQVFISTHSPTFINEMDEETTVIKIVKKEKGLQAIPINEKSELREFKHQFGLFNSDFLFEDSLIFVEGPSDKRTFELWFELLYPSNHSVRFIEMGGEKEIQSSLILSFMLQLQQNFSLFSILDSDRFTPENKKNSIIDDLKGRAHHLVEEIGEEEIKNYIYALHKNKLESYFEIAPKVLAEWLEVSEKEIQEVLSRYKGSSDRKLKLLAKHFGSTFKKVRDLPKLAQIMKKHDVDLEIQRLLAQIISNQQ